MSNLTEEQLRKYVYTFKATYLQTASKFLTPDTKDSLFKYSLLQGHIVGYVSTNFGAGFEYIPYGSSQITIQRSSSRIEDLIFSGMPPRYRKLPPMIATAGEDTKIIKCEFVDRIPVRLTDEKASVFLVDVTCRAAGWEKFISYAELYGNRKEEFWTEARAVGLAKDEILVALTDFQEAQKRAVSLRDYLSQFKEKTVLMLGDYSPTGKSRLFAMKQACSDLGYAPITLDDIPDDFHYDLRQKAIAVGSVSRFIVIDDSSSSGHLVEFPYIDMNRWVAIILRLEGSQSTFMTHGASLTSRMIFEYEYRENNLPEVLKIAVGAAEERIKDLSAGLRQIYPWRQQDA